MQLPQISSETDYLSYTVRILEGIGRIIALGEILLRYRLDFDVARLCDLVAYGYRSADRDILEQPFCMLYRKSDASGGSYLAELVVLGSLQGVRVVVARVRYGVEQDIRCDMGAILTPRRSHQLMPVQLILDRERTGRCAAAIAGGRADKCFDCGVAAVYDDEALISIAGGTALYLDAPRTAHGHFDLTVRAEVIQLSVDRALAGHHLAGRLVEVILYVVLLQPSGLHLSVGIKVVGAIIRPVPSGDRCPVSL